MLTLQENSLNWALQHALNIGDTDVFPTPFEYQAIQHSWETILPDLTATDTLTWQTRPPRALLSPKAKYGFRVVTQLDPIDFLLYSALIYEIANDIESNRVPTDQRRVFSYRILTTREGQLFDPNIGYRAFLETCAAKINHYGDNCYIATADISDFYSRIYHHRLENALNASTRKSLHVKSLMQLLSGWNGRESYGIPIGCEPSAVLAEITLSDIDEMLIAYGIDFVRFNDDYRIFTTNYSQAYKNITILAESLFKNHGLSLQAQKTSILEASTFSERYLTTPLEREMDSLYGRFSDLLQDLGVESWYQEIAYDELNPEQQAMIDTMNLVELFSEEIETANPDMPVIKFCLRRLGQLGNDEIIEPIFDNLNALTPVFIDVVKYFSNLKHLGGQYKAQLGGRLLDLFSNSIVSELPYHRMWIIDLFSKSQEWGNDQRFFNLFHLESEQACKRKLILAMGRAGTRHWFQAQWRTLFDHPHWQRRALLAAASCLPSDARKHWYQSIMPRLDMLEVATVRWAKTNPFQT
jgi:hypothetical protein